MTDTFTESTTPMTDTTLASAQEATLTPTPAKGKNRLAAAQPVLEKLFELYPQLFGHRFVPLKLGIFQELMAQHPNVFKRDDLKLALGVHTRSTRYLQSVAAGTPRHDLQGMPVEPLAPEHVFLSVIELFTRRQARTAEDLRPKLHAQLVVAYEQSGLLRADYLARIGTLTEDIGRVLEEAIVQVDQQRARRTALVMAFEASGKPIAEFADMFGISVRDVKTALSAAGRVH